MDGYFIPAGSHLAITPTGCYLVGPLAHPPTPPVDEADVEALREVLGAVDSEGLFEHDTRDFARRLWLEGVRPPAVTP